MKSTKEVAEQLNLSTQVILTAISRHPELRPQQRFGRNYIWSDEDVERFVNREKSKGGRPKKIDLTQ